MFKRIYENTKLPSNRSEPQNKTLVRQTNAKENITHHKGTGMVKIEEV